MELIYPTLTNTRTCPLAVPAWGECIKFVFDTEFTAQTNVGLAPFVQFTVTQTTLATGQTITVNGIIFTVNNASGFTNSATHFAANTGSAQLNAANFAGAIMSNPAFQNTDVTVTQSGANYLVRVTWHDPQLLTPFVNVSPTWVISGSNAGINPAITAGYGLGFQIFSENGQIYPKRGEFEFVPVVRVNQLSQNIEIEINDILQGLVSTPYPNFPNLAGIEPTMRKKFWIRWGYVKTVDCGRVWVQPMQTTPEYVYNIALQNEDKNGICTYVGRGLDDANNVIQRKFLTRRINSCVHKNDNDWLWIILDDEERDGITATYTYRIIQKDKDGATISTEVKPLGTVDYVYRIPSGWANNTLLANTKSFDIEVLVNGAVVAKNTTKLTTCKADTHIWFLNDLGGYDLICFEAKSSIEVESEKTIECVHAPCFQQDLGANFGQTLRGFEKRPVKVKGMTKVKARSEWFDSSGKETELFLRSFLNSPILYAQTERANGVLIEDNYALPQSIYIAGGSKVIQNEEGKIQLEIEYYYSKGQNVQL